MVFTWRVAQAKDVPVTNSATGNFIEQIEARDASTFAITWKTTYSQALALHLDNLWLLPSHILSEPFAQDRQAFTNLPYWTTEFVHLGPFRLTDFGLGETLVLDRFDDYFLGLPKLDRIVIAGFGNQNVLLANLRAGGIDLVTDRAFTSDVALQLRDEWTKNDEGTVFDRQDNFAYIQFQFDPQWARPLAMSQDVRIRRGLMYALDRASIREFLVPGVAFSNADTFLVISDPRNAVVGQPFAHYLFDQRLAAQELAAAGWTKASDGILLNAAGQPVQIEVRGNQNDVKPVALEADFRRRLGIDATETIIPVNLTNDGEYRSKFPVSNPSPGAVAKTRWRPLTAVKQPRQKIDGQGPTAATTQTQR